MENIPSLFRLKIRGIGNGIHQVNLSAPANKLDMPMFSGDVKAEGEMIVGEQIELHLHLEATGSFICDRCISEFEQTFTPKLDLYYVPPQLAKDIEEDDNIHIFNQQTNEIDFTPDVRDALLLAIPMKNLCRDDCEGVELAEKEFVTDERLASLGSLYKHLREEEMNSDVP
jgi:uncharacterized protein